MYRSYAQREYHDLYLNSFEDATETAITLGDVVKTHVYLEKLNTEKDVKGGPDEAVSDAEVHDRVTNIDRLPPRIRDFIRLQNEIAFRDAGQILAIHLPMVLLKHAVPGRTLKGLKSGNEHMERIRQFLRDMEEWFRQMLALFKKIERVEASIQVMERHIDAVMDTLGKYLGEEELREIKPLASQVRKELREAQAEIAEQKEFISSERMPGAAEIREIDNQIDQKAGNIQRLSNAFFETVGTSVKKLVKRKPVAQAAAVAAEAAFPPPPIFQPDFDIHSYREGLGLKDRRGKLRTHAEEDEEGEEEARHHAPRPEATTS